MWLIWKWRKTKDRFSEIKIEMNQKHCLITFWQQFTGRRSLVPSSSLDSLDSRSKIAEGRREGGRRSNSSCEQTEKVSNTGRSPDLRIRQQPPLRISLQAGRRSVSQMTWCEPRTEKSTYWKGESEYVFPYFRSQSSMSQDYLNQQIHSAKHRWENERKNANNVLQQKVEVRNQWCDWGLSEALLAYW